MSTAARLLAFAAGLVLVFVVTFTAGAAFGPGPDRAPASDAPAEHTDHTEPSR